MQHLRRAFLTMLGLGALALGGCETTTSGGAVGADRSQLLLVSEQQVDQMAAESYQELKAQAASQGALNQDGAMVQRVREITARLVPHTSVFRADAPGWDWQVNVIDSEQLNAFVMPGGRIMIYSGMIEQLRLSDAELAVVLGHEIAHALREHVREHMSQAMAAQTAIGLGTALTNLGPGSAEVAKAGYQALIATRFSRSDEREADRIGLELTARAGYDPSAGVSLWQKMMAASSGGQPPEFLSSHPSQASRVQEIQALLPTVLPLYNAAPRG